MSQMMLIEFGMHAISKINTIPKKKKKKNTLVIMVASINPLAVR
jgi:hypothetical protein